MFDAIWDMKIGYVTPHLLRGLGLQILSVVGFWIPAQGGDDTYV